MKQNMDLPSSEWNLLKVFVLICTTLVSTLSFGQAGNAPMAATNFPGPFAIDGSLTRLGANGDWLAPAGTDVGNNRVFTNAGVALVPLAYIKTDLFDDQTNDDIFDGGNKLFQDPNVWGWRSQKPPAKDDINNAMIFLALNPIDQHIWLAISGDRLSTNGTSYLDFEFYQNPIVKTGGPIPGGTGGFQSDGPHGGRTIGDISITLEYTGGGSFATVKYLQWQSGSEAGSYDYFPLNPPLGTAFAAANGGAAPISVPYGAFGSTQYTTLQFVEGAIDLTVLIGGTGFPGECGSLPFKSLFIKSKSSAETTADLKDFIAPFGIAVCFDHTNPVITCPPPIVLGCNPTIPGPDFTGGSATDNCNGNLIPVAADGPISSNGCNRSMTRVWRATDGCNNAATCGQLITWTVDNTAPTITTGGTVANGANLGCNPTAGAINGALGTATASDNCGTPTLSAPSDGAVSSDGCSRSQTRSWTAVDACSGITATASRTISWTVDPIPPTITTGGTVGNGANLGCNPTAGAINGALGTATATDACSNPTVTAPTDSQVSSDGCSRSQTRRWTATDACGNTSTASRTISWIADLTPPTITTGGTVANGANLGCNPTAGAINGALGTATATDACSNPTVTPSDDPVTSDGCSRSQTRRWIAVDGCGNTSAASRTISWVVDVTPPVFTGTYGPEDLGCNPSAELRETRLGGATATDACGAVTITPSDANIQSSGCSRTATRTFTARDGCGNTATISRTITWTADNTPPGFTGSYSTVQLGCNPIASDITNALGSASATDACGTPTVTPSDGPVNSNGCGRSQTRTFTARDGCGNTATISRTVQWTTNPSPPTFTGNYSTVPLGCNPTASDIENALDGATATSNCGSISPTPSDGPVISTGCGRSKTRTFTASDGCGNSATISRTVTWTEDVTPPAITTGGTVANGANLGCNPTGAAINGALGTATATDACGNPTLSAPSDGAVSSDGCSRSQTRRWTATDACGNTSAASRTINWIADLTPPTITTGGTVGNGANLGCNPTGAAINGALGTATATDACSNPTVSAPSDGVVSSDGCSRSQTRTWTATDACGNTSTASRTISWIVDLTPPTITTGGTVGNGANLGCNPTDAAINGALGTATATDACSNPTVSAPSDGPVTSDGCTRSQTRRWTATDACGNTSTASRTISWIADLTPPTITTGGTVGDGANLGCNPTGAAINGALGTATATDACSNPTVSAPSDGPVSSDGCSRSQTRRWTATDACGNTSTAARTVRWTADNTPPVFTNVPASVDLDCGASVPEPGTATATDACGTPTVTLTGNNDASADCSTGFNRVVTRTWTARDACGNTSTASQTIRVKCCPKAFCTYTQGQYGTEGGGGCDGVGSNLSTYGLISLGLSRWPSGTLVVGKAGRSITMSNNATDIACIIDELPGNQGSTEIASGNFGICGLPASMLTNQHRIKNVLAGQTITLGINMGINVQLGGFTLQAGVMATQDLAGGCGTTTPKTRVCHYNTLAPYNLTSVENQYTFKTFSSALIAAIPGTKNVTNLFELANRALGNSDGVAGSENGVSLDEIQQAVANINEGFDECMAFIGWNVAACPATDPTPGDGRMAPTSNISSETLNVEAFPNPYKENFSLKVNSPVTGQASISFYTMDGVKIGEMKRDVVAKKDVWIPYNVPAVYRTRIVYTVNVGKHNAKGIVLSPN